MGKTTKEILAVLLEDFNLFLSLTAVQYTIHNIYFSVNEMCNMFMTFS